MPWGVIGVVIGLLPFALMGIRYVLSLRGPLAGYWYQVTYARTDEQMTEPCFSIELMRLRHWRDTVKGTWWRIYPEAFNKKWSWEGRVTGALIIGSYFAWRKSKAGGSGNFFMMEIDAEGRAKGHFMCVVVEDTKSGGVGYEPLVQPMEWLRADRCTGAELASWIESLPGRPCDCKVVRGKDAAGHNAAAHLPWYARRALGHSGWPNAAKQGQKGFAYVATASSSLGAGALEAAEREAAEAPRPPLPKFPPLRRTDILGRARRSPRERPSTT
jgi:hypothetical protein